jgi:hypothetical protein
MKRHSSSHLLSQLLVSVPEPVLPEDEPQWNRVIGDCRESFMRECNDYSELEENGTDDPTPLVFLL